MKSIGLVAVVLLAAASLSACSDATEEVEAQAAIEAERAAIDAATRREFEAELIAVWNDWIALSRLYLRMSSLRTGAADDRQRLGAVRSCMRRSAPAQTRGEHGQIVPGFGDIRQFDQWFLDTLDAVGTDEGAVFEVSDRLLLERDRIARAIDMYESCEARAEATD